MLFTFEFIRVGKGATRFAIKWEVAEILSHNIVVHTVSNSYESDQELVAWVAEDFRVGDLHAGLSLNEVLELLDCEPFFGQVVEVDLKLGCCLH